jgi:Rod binding domain-containing protein
MDAISQLPASPGGISSPQQPTRQQIETAAQQFEGLLLHQLLKSASGGDGGWMGTGEEDTAGLQALDLAQEQFAAALSARGGLGLAKMVIPQLTAESEPSPIQQLKHDTLNHD